MEKQESGNDRLKSFIGSLKIGQADRYRNLTVFPVYSDLATGNGFALVKGDEVVHLAAFA